jgi:Carboxypeptidase regulatory-like domain
MNRLGFHTLLAAVLTSAAAWGQIGGATILGTVTDPANSVIVGATIKVTHLPTNTVTTVASNGSGLYTVPDLPVGPYQLTVEMQGFKRVLRSGIVLQVGDRALVDFRLEVGTVVESVEVTGAAPLVDTADATMGKVIENMRMTNLPLNGRSALALAILTPNVRSYAQSPSGFGDRGVLVSGFSVNGGPRVLTQEIVM